MKHLTVSLIFLASVLSLWAQDQSPIEYIKQESIGGKLDFMKELEEQGKAKKLVPYEGTVYSSNEFAIIRWAEEVHNLGLRSSKEAIELWEFIYQRELSHDEIKVFKKGFKLKTRS